MIDTLYATDALNSPKAFFLSLLIGLFFGVFLEQAGFGSSRKLAGVFYFRDMAVIKVMFSAVVTAMLGLAYFLILGWIELDALYLLPTIYSAQVVGGVIFGIGFVICGWCPGTAAAGLASGKIDALVALLGAVLGSMLYSELYPSIKELASIGNEGVLFVFESAGISKPLFIFLFVCVAVICFVLCEILERTRKTGLLPVRPAFLASYGLVLIVFAGGLFIVPSLQTPEAAEKSASGGSSLQESVGSVSGSVAPAVTALETLETRLLEDVEKAKDHIEPEDLADRLMNADPNLIVVDLRSAAEYARFHLRGAIRLSMQELHTGLEPYMNQGMIVLYSNGMVHPAQARDSLFRMGYENVFILTEGLNGFMERCLKPVSLRTEPMTQADADKIRAWRNCFLD